MAEGGFDFGDVGGWGYWVGGDWGWGDDGCSEVFGEAMIWYQLVRSLCQARLGGFCNYCLSMVKHEVDRGADEFLHGGCGTAECLNWSG